MDGIGTELNVDRGAAEVELAAELQTRGVNFVEESRCQCPHRRQRGMADYFRGLAFDADVAGDGECGEVDSGDCAPVFIGYEGMPFEPDSLFPGAG